MDNTFQALVKVWNEYYNEEYELNAIDEMCNKLNGILEGNDMKTRVVKKVSGIDSTSDDHSLYKIQIKIDKDDSILESVIVRIADSIIETVWDDKEVYYKYVEIINTLFSCTKFRYRLVPYYKSYNWETI